MMRDLLVYKIGADVSAVALKREPHDGFSQTRSLTARQEIVISVRLMVRLHKGHL